MSLKAVQIARNGGNIITVASLRLIHLSQETSNALFQERRTRPTDLLPNIGTKYKYNLLRIFTVLNKDCTDRKTQPHS